MTNVAVVGATGAVGRTMLSILEERSFPVDQLRLAASARSAGMTVDTFAGPVVVEDLSILDPSGIDIALFSAGGGISRDFGPPPPRPEPSSSTTPRPSAWTRKSPSSSPVSTTQRRPAIEESSPIRIAPR